MRNNVDRRQGHIGSLVGPSARVRRGLNLGAGLVVGDAHWPVACRPLLEERWPVETDCMERFSALTGLV
jgi:hypothetical protein